MRRSRKQTAPWSDERVPLSAVVGAPVARARGRCRRGSPRQVRGRGPVATDKWRRSEARVSTLCSIHRTDGTNPPHSPARFETSSARMRLRGEPRGPRSRLAARDDTVVPRRRGGGRVRPRRRADSPRVLDRAKRTGTVRRSRFTEAERHRAGPRPARGARRCSSGRCGSTRDHDALPGRRECARQRTPADALPHSAHGPRWTAAAGGSAPGRWRTVSWRWQATRERCGPSSLSARTAGWNSRGADVATSRRERVAPGHRATGSWARTTTGGRCGRPLSSAVTQARAAREAGLAGPERSHRRRRACRAEHTSGLNIGGRSDGRPRSVGNELAKRAEAA